MTDERHPIAASARRGSRRGPDARRYHRMRARFAAAMASAKSASERHVALAVPLRAAERNRRVAASVLAGGLAYRLFLWCCRSA